MPALSYESLGAIRGVTETPKAPGSSRSRDRNDKQRIAFECDPAQPFTGLIHVQAAVGDPTRTEEDSLWFDLAEMDINNEGGSWSYEPQGEFSSVRVVCKQGNYWAAVSGIANGAVSGAQVLGDPSFDIDGTTITIPAGSTAGDIIAAIDQRRAINPLFNFFADLLEGNILRIYQPDGDTFTTSDVNGSPLADMGIQTGTVRAGVIAKIRMLR